MSRDRNGQTENSRTRFIVAVHHYSCLTSMALILNSFARTAFPVVECLTASLLWLSSITLLLLQRLKDGSRDVMRRSLSPVPKVINRSYRVLNEGKLEIVFQYHMRLYWSFHRENFQ